MGTSRQSCLLSKLSLKSQTFLPGFVVVSYCCASLYRAGELVAERHLFLPHHRELALRGRFLTRAARKGVLTDMMWRSVPQSPA